MMAAGLLTIAHRSGGPLMDIITEETGSRNGFLAVTPQEYAAHIAFIISMSEEVKIFLKCNHGTDHQNICRLETL